jgi:hypothetical protein
MRMLERIVVVGDSLAGVSCCSATRMLERIVVVGASLAGASCC